MSDSGQCSCGNPILRWVHNQPPTPCGEVSPAEPNPEEEIAAARARMDQALKTALGTFYLKKNTPFTRFQIAQRLRPLLAQALDLTDKKLGVHFDIAVTPKGIDVIPKTEWAKALLPK